MRQFQWSTLAKYLFYFRSFKIKQTGNRTEAALPLKFRTLKEFQIHLSKTSVQSRTWWMQRNWLNKTLNGDHFMIFMVDMLSYLLPLWTWITVVLERACVRPEWLEGEPFSCLLLTNYVGCTAVLPTMYDQFIWDAFLHSRFPTGHIYNGCLLASTKRFRLKWKRKPYFKKLSSITSRIYFQYILDYNWKTTVCAALYNVNKVFRFWLEIISQVG